MFLNILRSAAPHSLVRRMLCSIVFFTLITGCIKSYGQNFYYFQYKLPHAGKKPLTYDIFLYISYEGTATARIVLNDPATGKKRLFKLNYVDNDFPDRSDGDKVVYLMPFGNAFDENNKPVSSFMMPWFQFNKTQPYVLNGADVKAYISKQASPLTGTYQEMQAQDLNKAFIKRFYAEDDVFYKYFFNINVPKLRTAEKGENLYMIAIAAIDDPLIGETTQIDLQSLQSLFGAAAFVLGYNYRYTEIAGKNFTKAVVEDAIDKLKPRPQDIVIVYYSGHGFRYTNDASPYPRMALVPNPYTSPDTANLSIEDVYNRVSKKGANVTIVLADCCNENYGIAPPLGEVKPFAAPLAGQPILNTDNWRALFLPKHPVALLACAADKNQLAAGNTHLGGFFTNYTIAEIFKSLFGNTGQGETSWALIINNAREYTRRQAQTIVCKEGACDINGRDIQTPEMKLVSEK